MKQPVPGKRIGWFDSTRNPSRIHRTIDEGVTTVCGHPVRKMTEQKREFGDARWVISDTVPRRIYGESRYCRVCFKDGGKALPFYNEQKHTAREIKRNRTEPPDTAVCGACKKPFGKGCSAGYPFSSCMCGHFDECPHAAQVVRCAEYWKQAGFLKKIDGLKP